jgi:hypothetical protein
LWKNKYGTIWCEPYSRGAGDRDGPCSRGAGDGDGTHVGDRHGSRASDGEGAHAGDARGWGHGRRPTSGGRGAPDGGVPDGEGARAAHRTEGRRTERVHGPGMHAGGGAGCGWRRAGVGRRRVGGEVGVFPAGVGGESVGEIWKLLPASVSTACGRVYGMGKPYPLQPGLSLNFQRLDPGREKVN